MLVHSLDLACSYPILILHARTQSWLQKLQLAKRSHADETDGHANILIRNIPPPSRGSPHSLAQPSPVNFVRRCCKKTAIMTMPKASDLGTNLGDYFTRLGLQRRGLIVKAGKQSTVIWDREKIWGEASSFISCLSSRQSHSSCMIFTL